VTAVDTNVLVYAHRRDSPWHQAAFGRISELAQGRSPWCIPWSCLHEFMAIVTHPRIYAPPSRLAQAIDQVDAWLESPSVTLLAETEGYWATLKSLLEEGRITGPMVHDARVAAVCLLHGVRELWTADRDFGRFGRLTVRNPLVP
jgi:toxin-antitoxin system PIN domain toxin